MTSVFRWAAVGPALLAVGLAGCSPGAVTVKGKVLKGGAPMVVSKDTYVTLSFYPEAGAGEGDGGRSYSAKFDAESGTYSVDLPPGKYRLMVVIALPPKKPGAPPAPLPPHKPDTVYDLTKSQDLDIEVPGK